MVSHVITRASQHTGCATPGVTPGTLWTWAGVRQPCRLLSCSSCTSGGLLTEGEVVRMGGGNPVPSHQLSCKPKTALRNKVCVRQRTMLSQEVRQEKEAAEKQGHQAKGPWGRPGAGGGHQGLCVSPTLASKLCRFRCPLVSSQPGPGETEELSSAFSLRALSPCGRDQ